MLIIKISITGFDPYNDLHLLYIPDQNDLPYKENLHQCCYLSTYDAFNTPILPPNKP